MFLMSPNTLFPLLFISTICSVVNGQLGESRLSERPYVVFQNQNLVLLVSVFSVLLVVMIIMAVCVYKPVRRR
ncbi:hypothetical protein AALO_G00067220 [Alosa alosa]|uniref:NADH dehydrogenase subunit 6 n=1 Tax=Alosa alosa TaxID=278164 RepID=A0AAV6H195_9TELE|nr:hypothetical protein AALO_G00067220 [Alosa alosa]